MPILNNKSYRRFENPIKRKPHQNNEENKLEQNAELAKLRAGVSLAKQNKQRTN